MSEKKLGVNLKDCDILSVDQLSPSLINKIFSKVPVMKKLAISSKASNLLKGKIVILLFYEPSSRTFASFSASVKQLGGQTVEIIDPTNFSSVSKGETFEDTIRTFEAYSDLIVLRHPEKGAAQKAADAAQLVPVINAGDGIGEHPTQALLDLYTVYEKFNRLDNLTGIMAGDILNGRTIHSLIKALSLYKNNTLYLLSPKELSLSKKDFESFQGKGVKLVQINKEEDMPKNADFWYWTRVQKERFQSKSEYEKVKNRFILSPELTTKFAGKNTIFMHPLPRVGEIDTLVDNDNRAVYLRSQIRNGMYVRMALLILILGAKI